MLDEKRIKEAKANYPRYLEDGLLMKKQSNKTAFNMLLKNSEESLKVADKLLKNSISDFWVIVISYYSMFYMANAVLCNLGYKLTGNMRHKITADCLIVLIRGKLKESFIEQFDDMQNQAMADIQADELIYSFDRERGKRGDIQYDTNEEAKRSMAETSINRAKEFNMALRKLLPRKN